MNLKDAIKMTTVKLQDLGIEMQKVQDTIKKCTSAFNRFGAIYEYRTKIEEATETCCVLITILEPYWKGKENTIKNLATQRSIQTAKSFVGCLKDIQHEIHEGVLLHQHNEVALREFQILLVEGGWL